MHIFDYSFLRELAISPEFSIRLSKIEGFKVRTQDFAKKNPLTAKDMAMLSKMMSVRESNEIEGILTEDSRIYSLLTSRVKPRGHSEYEILGYSEALSKIHEEHDEMELDEETILQLFAILESHTDADSGYKRRNNEIVDKDDSGRIVKRYKVVSAAETKDAMEQIIAAFNDARNDFSIPNILLIPCFIMDFLKIHPFMDGNGRMSRLLSILLLYQEGFTVCSYVSLEAIINQSKYDYYDALALSGEGWFENESDYLPFMEYMIGVIYLAHREMDRRMAVCIGREDKEHRIERLISNISIPISKGEIASLMPDISETYVELILSKMLKEGKIVKIGSRKSSRYLPNRK